MSLDDEVAEIRDAIGRLLGGTADLTIDLLGGSLWRIDVVPRNSGAASVTIIASKAEVIVEAGIAFRAELPPLSTGHEPVLQIIAAVADGQLRERITNGRGRFELTLASGDTIKGTQNRVRSGTGRAGAVEYTPYPPG